MDPTVLPASEAKRSATGSLPFRGDTSGIIFEAILNRAPVAPVRLNPDLPAKLEELINRALEKDRNLRYQHAADLRVELQRLKRDTESARYISAVDADGASGARKSKVLRRRVILGTALAAVLIALGFGWRWYEGPQIAPSPTSEQQLTHNASENRLLFDAISPDGKHLAYADTKGLHLSVVETGEVHEIPLPDELRTRLAYVGWFPDGEELLFSTRSQAEGYRFLIGFGFRVCRR